MKGKEINAEGGKQLIAGIILALVSGLLYGLYSQAEGLDWGFDDWINLKDLSQVSNYEGLINFIFGGIAGPSGRPVALLAFIPNYVDWPKNPFAFVVGNLVWHFLNTLLIFLFFSRILRVNTASSSSLWLAALAAAVWAILPIHASSLLMPVQRMTHVSAFFSLIAINIFVYWRTCHAGRNNIPIALLSLSTIVFSILLSVYAKENGVLTIAYIAVVELVLLKHLPAPIHLKLWKVGVWGAILFIPVLLAAYLYLNWSAIHVGYTSSRNFTLSERLATEGIILWEYIKNVVAPRPALMGPFHDGHKVYNWEQWWVWIGAVAWVLVAAGAVAWAKTGAFVARSFLFAVGFFLMGHLLESTFVPLELYFEHRNYLPVLGLIFFVMVLFRGALQQPAFKLITCGLFVIVLSYNIFSLYQLTSLWGQPELAARMWHQMHPSSTRAVQTLAKKYSQKDLNSMALALLDDFSSDNTLGRFDVKIQAFVLACEQERFEQLSVRLQELREAMDYIGMPNGIATGLPSMGKAIRGNQCRGVSLKIYKDLLLELISQRKVTANGRIRHYINFELSQIARLEEQYDDYFLYAKAAFHDFPSLSLANQVGLELFQRKREKDALQWIDEAMDSAPGDISGEAWRKSLNSLRSAILEIQDLRVQYLGHDG